MTLRKKLQPLVPIVIASAVAFLIGSCTNHSFDHPGFMSQPTPAPFKTTWLANTPHGAAIGENSIADLAEDTMKSVVNIDTTTRISVPQNELHGFGFPFDLFGGEPLVPHMEGFEMRGTGSGVIIGQDGYILTNNHVVGNANNIKVTLNDKRVLKGTVIGRDSFTDIALVKVDASGLPIARLGTAKNLRPGDFVIAIGSPAGLSNTVTFGIVSALGRTLGEHLGDVGLVQTDAAINPGNSGGPLLNIHGEVIGINTAIKQNFQNIGFAIPVDTAKQVGQQLMKSGTIKHPYVGVQMADLSDALDRQLGLPAGTQGIVIAKVVPNSPADDAGLQNGDLIKKIDNTPVSTSAEVQKLVRQHQPGDHLAITVSRDGQETTVNLTVGNYPERQSE
jgi:S1-C subfamily serine protease